MAPSAVDHSVPLPRPCKLIEEVEVSPASVPRVPSRSERTTVQDGQESHTILEHFGEHQLSVVRRSVLQDDDDESLPLLEESDFHRETWLTTLLNKKMPPPITVGLAVVAAATVIFNPFIVVAGAATAVGAVHMIERGYDILWSDTTVDESEAETETSKELQTCRSIARDDDVPVLLEQQPTFETLASDGEELLVEARGDWVSLYFPPLSDTVVSDVNFDSLNALEFFRVFLHDDAPFKFQEFQKQRGDIDIVYGNWRTCDSDVLPMSIHPRAPQTEALQHNFLTYERSISFKTLTNRFLTPYAQANKMQRVFVNKRFMILESRTHLKNIPFCDRFYIMERWFWKSPKPLSKETRHCTMSVECQVFFTQPCAFEGQIITKSISTLSEVVTCWCQMATLALDTTKQTKRTRADTYFHDDDNAIEVQHSHSSGSFVIVNEQEEEIREQPVVVTPPPRAEKRKPTKKSVMQRIIRKSCHL